MTMSLPVGWRLVWRLSVGSTNDEAKALAEIGEQSPCVIWAWEQLSGRGRKGRNWQSPPGNLYCSVLIRPNCLATNAAEIAFVVGLAISDAIESSAPGISLKLKWPNDVMADNAKLAGILLESAVAPNGRLSWLVIGIGVNITSHPVGVAYPATSLTALGAVELCPGKLLTLYIAELEQWLYWWQKEGFAVVRDHWLRRAWRLGNEVMVRCDTGIVRGRFVDIDFNGALILETEKGNWQRITAGDVFLGG
jgi:BirA family biotin operon repressor/biotin-[acetyl-CoA-carboxylase] ligase